MSRPLRTQGAGLVSSIRRTRVFALLRRAYGRWVDDYRRYAEMRGFRSFNDWSYHRRGFIECWGQPGFHRFWQVWNPGIAYFIYRVYLAMGGRRHRTPATLGAFLFCGLAHTLIVFPFFGRWSNAVVAAFGCFGVLTVLSRWLSPLLRQDRWPALVNVAVNVGLVLGSFDLGFRVDGIL